ncbi:MAG: hypothetical protein HQ523_02325 [Lentisphaerae bacterium]|nr:hypothetical protein [Lentisphaerota bacterium]
MTTAQFVGVAGGLLGLTGGIVGAYFSIKNTNGPKERAFVAKGSVVALLTVLLVAGLMIFLPKPSGALMWIPFGLLMFPAIKYWNRKQENIRQEELQGGAERQ